MREGGAGCAEVSWERTADDRLDSEIKSPVLIRLQARPEDPSAIEVSGSRKLVIVPAGAA